MFACVCPDKKFMTLNILDEIFIKQPIDTFDVKHSRSVCETCFTLSLTPKYNKQPTTNQQQKEKAICTMKKNTKKSIDACHMR